MNRKQGKAAVASGLTLGLVVGIPYYSLPFFYDYFERPVSAGGFGWSRAAIVLGLPLGTLVTLVAGPLLARRAPARGGIAAGALVCGAAVAGFGWMEGSLAAYYGWWLLYMAGWSFAGPMMHQILLTRAFEGNRGATLATAFFGLSLFGAGSVAGLARPLTEALGPAAALRVMGLVVACGAPIAWWGLPRMPKGGALGEEAERKTGAWREVLRRRDFWLLLTGSTLTAAGIGGVSQHLKLILRERGFTRQSQLDEVFGWTLLLMLVAGALGRFAFGWSADRFPRRRVLTVAVGLMLVAIPLLQGVGGRAGVAYLFAVVFGLGMSSDTVMTTLLAAERLGPEGLAPALAVLVPVNTVGQTWFPFVVSLLWEATGRYDWPLVVIFLCILGGRMLLMSVPERDAESV